MSSISITGEQASSVCVDVRTAGQTHWTDYCYKSTQMAFRPQRTPVWVQGNTMPSFTCSCAVVNLYSPLSAPLILCIQEGMNETVVNFNYHGTRAVPPDSHSAYLHAWIRLVCLVYYIIQLVSQSCRVIQKLSLLGWSNFTLRTNPTHNLMFYMRILMWL